MRAGVLSLFRACIKSCVYGSRARSESNVGAKWSLLCVCFLTLQPVHFISALKKLQEGWFFARHAIYTGKGSNKNR